jgi:cardiolipin synthase
VRATLRAAAPARPLMAWPRKRIAWAGRAPVVATIVATLVVVNLLPPERRVDERIEHRYAVGSPPFFRSLGVLLGPPTLDGNRVVGFQNGDEIFPAMLAAIRGARAHDHVRDLHLLVGRGRPSSSPSALVERATRRRARPRAARLGRLAENRGRGCWREMRDAGIEIELYRPLRWYHLARSTTARTASCSSSTGASASPAASASRTSGKATPGSRPLARQPLPRRGPGRRADAGHVRRQLVEGRGGVLHGDDYFPPVERGGGMRAQMFSSSPEGGADSMQLMYLLSITSAARSIALASAYFVPDELTTDALVERAEAGRARAHPRAGPIIDTDVVRTARRGAGWEPLLARAPRSTSTSRRCSTARCWSSTSCSCRSGRPTSTCARSGSTTRPTSTSTTPRSRGASSRSSSAT